VKVLITGGSSGIGKHLTGAYLSRGDQVVILAEDADRLETARKELSLISPAVTAVACDVADAATVAWAVDVVLAGSGCPDVIVNNAGFAVYRAFEQSSFAEIDRLIRVNLLGTLNVIRGFLPAMIERRSGHIVNVASIAGLMPVTPCAVYSAAKHGVVGISETLRCELRDFNIQVHVVCPGRVETAFFDHETFRRRPRRPETEKTVPIEKVSAAIIDAVEKGRFFTVIPRTLGWVVWLRNLCPPLVDFWLSKLLAVRAREARTLAVKE